MQNILNSVSSFVWGPAMLALFLFTGLFLTARTRFFSVLHANIWFKKTIFAAVTDKSVRKSRDCGSISRFQALTSALAACLGTGNVIGVATAISSGGAGSVFWMWLSAVLGMATACCENILGIRYRVRDKRGNWIAGAMMYIERGLGMPWLSAVFCVLLTGTAFGMGCMTQANSAAQALEGYRIPPAVTGMVLFAVTFAIIKGGIKRIASFTEKLIPVLSISFMLGAFIIICKNFRSLPEVFSNILKEAFTLKSASGFGLSKAMRYGVARGVFSNEAGLGSSPIIHGASDTDSPAEQGLWGMAEVFIDTVFMCCVTAAAILSSGVADGSQNSGTLCSLAFESVFGPAGKAFICLSICLFAFSTLVAWSHYGKTGINYIRPMKKETVFSLIYCICAFIGAVAKLETIWSVADIFNALMAIPNIFAVLCLSKEATNELKIYI